MNIIPTDVAYNYYIMKNNIVDLAKVYPFLSVSSVGNSVLGLDIPVLKIGVGPKKLLYFASIHSNEYITSVLLMKFLEDYSLAFSSNSNIFNISAKQLYNSSTIYIIPMVNPDGVNLVTGAFSKDSEIYIDCKRIASFFPSIPFPDGWKANIKGVDLNLQFPARVAKR